MTTSKKQDALDTQMEPAFATVREAATYLRLSRGKLYLLMAAGELAYARFGVARRIPWAGLRAYVERCTVAAAS